MLNLICACCGNTAPALKQWWNRDTGFGVCGRCVAWQLARGEKPETIKDHYGESGVHWLPLAVPPAHPFEPPVF